MVDSDLTLQNLRAHNPLLRNHSQGIIQELDRRNFIGPLLGIAWSYTRALRSSWEAHAEHRVPAGFSHHTDEALRASAAVVRLPCGSRCARRGSGVGPKH